MAPAKPKFSDHEKVFCYHGPLLYEAKCVRSKKDPKNPNDFLYFVHYQGWNKNWDEWVGETRILKVNSETVDKKSKLMKEHQSTVKPKSKKAGGGGGGGMMGKDGKDGTLPLKDRDRASAEKAGPTTPTPTSSAASSVPGTPCGIPSSSGGGRKSESASTSRASTPGSERSLKLPNSGSKRSAQDDDDDQSNSSREDESGGTITPSSNAPVQPMGNPCRKLSAATTKRFKELGASKRLSDKTRFKSTLPEELKFVLVSDWDLVVHKKSVFSLPAKVSANTIMQDFVQHSSDKEARMSKLRVSEVMLGVQELFDYYLEERLLYKIEGKQFEQVMERAGSGKMPSDVYGSAHLLRLLVKLPEVLNKTSLAGDESNVVLVEEIINEFHAFLETHRAKYFTSKNYVEASEELLADEK